MFSKFYEKKLLHIAMKKEGNFMTQLQSVFPLMWNGNIHMYTHEGTPNTSIDFSTTSTILEIL